MVKKVSLKSTFQKHLERAASLAFSAKAWNRLDFMVRTNIGCYWVLSGFLATENRHCKINTHWRGNGETFLGYFFRPFNNDMRKINDKSQEIRF